MKADEYKCTMCSYIYIPGDGDPGHDIAAGTPFEELPDSWTCPVCGAAKDKFRRIE